MATSIEVLEPGIFWRLHPTTGARSRYLSISYERDGRTVIESAKTASIIEAQKLRARRMAASAALATLTEITDRLHHDMLALEAYLRTCELPADGARYAGGK